MICVAAPRSALAGPDEEAAAEALFQAGMKLVKEGKLGWFRDRARDRDRYRDGGPGRRGRKPERVFQSAERRWAGVVG
jgi:hypothetical protein